MDVNNLNSLFNKLVPHIVAGKGSKHTSVKRFSASGDAFVGILSSPRQGTELASVSKATEVSQSGPQLSKLLKDAAKCFSSAA